MVGLALGLVGPLIAVAMASVPPERAGMGSGLVNVSRLVGATVGVAVLGSIFASISHGAPTPDAFVAGMRAALLVGAGAELLGGTVAYAFIRHDALRVGQPSSPARRRQYA